MAAWPHSAPQPWAAAVNVLNRKIVRVVFIGNDAPPPFGRSASSCARSVPVGPAHTGCAYRAPNSTRWSLARCVTCEPSRAPGRGFPLLCAGQSLAWLVPALSVFAADIPSATRRFVCRVRRLRAFVWLVRQFFARRLLARVARGSMILAHALNRIKVATSRVGLKETNSSAE